jgi:hypothetical protein
VNYLENISNKKEFLVLSRIPTHARELGFNWNFPWYDTMAEVVEKNDSLAVTSWIDKFGPDYLLIDVAMATSLYSKSNILQHSNIVSKLEKYRFHSKENGWNIYVRLSVIASG